MQHMHMKPMRTAPASILIVLWLCHAVTAAAAEVMCQAETFRGALWSAHAPSGVLAGTCNNGGQGPIYRSCAPDGIWSNQIDGRCSKVGCSGQPPPPEQWIASEMLALVTAETLKVTQSCVLAGQGPGFLGPASAARLYAAVATSMFNAWTLTNLRAIPTVPRPSSVTVPAVPPTDDRQKTYTVILAAFQTLKFIAPEAVQARNLAWVIKHNFGWNVEDSSVQGYSAVTAMTGLLHAKLLSDGFNQAGCYRDNTNYNPVNSAWSRPGSFNASSSVSAKDARRFQQTSWVPIQVTVPARPPQLFANVQAARGRPFSLASAGDYLARPLPSNFYPTEFEALLSIQSSLFGADGDINKAIVYYWLLEAGSPYTAGRWMNITITVANRVCSDLDEFVELLFAQANAQYDVGLAVWASKRFYNSPRPASYIPLVLSGLQASGRSTRTFANQYRGPYCPPGDIPGKLWTPYQPVYEVSPPFPEYPSGHAAFCQAGADILSTFFNRTWIPADIWHPGTLTGSVPAGSIPWEAKCSGASCSSCAWNSTLASHNAQTDYAPRKDVLLQWSTWQDMAYQCGYSRLLAGVHTPSGFSEGRTLGSLVAAAVYERRRKFVHTNVMESTELNPIPVKLVDGF